VELGMTNTPTAAGTGNILVQGQGGTSSILNPTTLKLTASNQIADTATVTIISAQYNGTIFDLNGFNETIGGLVVKANTGTVGIGVRTGSGGVLTVMGDITLNNNRGGPTGNSARDVLITGTGNRNTVAADSGILDLGGAVRTITVTSEQATIPPDSDATIETTIRNGGIIKAGAQKLFLVGTNTYTGGTTVQGGTLSIGAGSTTGSILGDVALANQSVLEFNRSNAYAFAGNITGDGVLNKLGAGVLTLSGSNTFTGKTTVKAGSLQVEKIGMVGVPANTNLGTAASIDLGDTTANVGLLYTGIGETTDKVLRLTGTTGTVTLGASGSGALVFQNQIQFVGLGARTLILTGTSTTANTLKQGITNATDNSVTTLQKTDTGTWVLEGANTYTGVTTVTGGVLRLDGEGTLTTPALRLQNGTFEISGEEDVTLAGDPSVTLAAGESTQNFYYALLLGGGPAGSSATVALDAGRTLHLGSNVGFSSTNSNLPASITGGNLDLGNAQRVFVVAESTNADPDLTISSTFTGTTNATLMKAAGGRMVLTQSLNIKNVYVNGGRLDLQGPANTITGNLQVGVNNGGSFYYGASGGTLNVGSGSSDVLDVGVTMDLQGYAYSTSFTGVMDLRGSQQFNVNVGRVRIGVHTSTAAGNGTPTLPSFNGSALPTSFTPVSTEVYLATNNQITASTSFVIGDAQSASVSGTHSLLFGAGTNIVNTPLMYVGYRKGSGQASIASGGSLEIKGIGEGARTALYIGYNAVNTGGATVNSLDMTNGRLTASLSSLTIGWKSGGSSTTAGSSIGSLTLGADSGNQVNVSGNVTIGYIAGTQASATTFGRGTLSMAGGTFDVGGDVILATVSSATTNANLTSTGTLNLTGGTFTVQGNILHTDDALDRGTATITLDGGTLDLTGGTVGNTGAQAITFQARSGILRSLGELNSGGTLTKTTTGVLRVEGTNTYSGVTQVQAGKLLVNGTHTNGGEYQVSAGATLGGGGSITLASAQNFVVSGTLAPGSKADGTVASTLTLTTTGSGLIILENGSRMEFDLTTAGTGTLNQGDLLVLNGELAVVGTTTLEIANPNALLNWAAGDTWQLFDWSGIIGGVPTVGTFQIGASFNQVLSGTNYTWDFSELYVDGTVSLQAAAVPEPGRMVLLAIAATAVVLRRRRRNTKNGD
jgi:autotransporter-associated beta strand protein